MRFFAILLTVLAGAVQAHDYTLGDISIAHPISYPSTGKAAAGYMMISNAGPDDTLIGVEADFPRVMIHNTIVEDGVAKMRHQMAVDVPTGGMVEFKPKGLHVMFMGLSEHLMVGTEIPAVLIFEHAGRVDVVFKVEERPEASATAQEDHSNH